MKRPTPDEVRQARTDAGLTQTQAANLVHTTLRTWQMYEAGDRQIDLAKWELFLIKTKGEK